MKLINKLTVRIFVTILIFIFQSWVKADDIKDFQIENMSVGDSLLKYYSLVEINKFDRNNYEVPEINKYYRLYIDNNFKSYDYISIDLKYDDNKFIIYGLNGMIDYDFNENNQCLKQQKKIKTEIEDIFNVSPYESKVPSRHDPEGKSFVHSVSFKIDNGKVLIQCYEFREEINIQPGLDLAIRLPIFSEWLNR